MDAKIRCVDLGTLGPYIQGRIQDFALGEPIIEMYSAQFRIGYMKLSFIFEKLVLSCSLHGGSR